MMEGFEISSKWPFKGLNLLLKNDVFFFCAIITLWIKLISENINRPYLEESGGFPLIPENANCCIATWVDHEIKLIILQSAFTLFWF